MVFYVHFNSIHLSVDTTVYGLMFIRHYSWSFIINYFLLSLVLAYKSIFVELCIISNDKTKKYNFDRALVSVFVVYHFLFCLENISLHSPDFALILSNAVSSHCCRHLWFERRSRRICPSVGLWPISSFIGRYLWCLD